MKTRQLMRRMLCAGIFAMTLPAPAMAADLAPGYAPPLAPVPMYRLFTWTGFYFGINGGGGWGRSQWDGINSFDVSGGVIGGTIGYNWQIGKVVLGAEGDLDWTSIDGTTTSVLCAPGCTTRNYWLATVRGRLGYAWGRFLPYLTGGLAVGDIKATRAGLPGGTGSNAGWTVGAGVEVGIVNNVSVKAEYLFVDLADFNCGLNCGLLPNGNVSFNANLFRAGINVRFPSGFW